MTQEARRAAESEAELTAAASAPFPGLSVGGTSARWPGTVRLQT